MVVATVAALPAGTRWAEAVLVAADSAEARSPDAASVAGALPAAITPEAISAAAGSTVAVVITVAADFTTAAVFMVAAGFTVAADFTVVGMAAGGWALNSGISGFGPIMTMDGTGIRIRIPMGMLLHTDTILMKPMAIIQPRPSCRLESGVLSAMATGVTLADGGN